MKKVLVIGTPGNISASTLTELVSRAIKWGFLAGRIAGSMK